MRSRPARRRCWRPNVSFVARHPYLLAALATVLIAGIAGLLVPALQTYPEGLQLSTGTFCRDVVAVDQRQFLRHVRGAQERRPSQPADPVQAASRRPALARRRRLLAFAGWRLGGLRLALYRPARLSFLIAATGQWEKAMITVYLCGISVLIAAADRHSDRHRSPPSANGCGTGCRRSSTRCRPCRPSST